MADNAKRDENRVLALLVQDTAGLGTIAVTGVKLTDSTALHVAMVDGNGDQITSFGGGTQYTTGAAEATPTGTLALGWDGTDVKALPLDGSGYLKVNVSAGSSGNAAASATGSAVPSDADYMGFDSGGNLVGVSSSNPLPITIQSGNPTSITANAGTNLNTSLLALESGGNLATIVTNTNKIPSLGQALAAGSVPVVLTAAQITTLTPPTNTGYALDSSLSTINTSLADVATLGAKTDAKSTATDGTSISIMSVLKEISAMEQAPASRAVTNAGTFAVQAAQSGTWNVGTVTTVTTVSTVSNISQIASTTPTFTSQALDVNIKSETAPAVTLTRVAIAASSSGDNTLIAAVTSKKIYVVAFELSFSGTVNAKFTDGASGTNLGGLYYGIANAGAANSISPDMKLAIPSPYLFVGSTNTALILNLSAGVAVGGAITYFTV